MSEAVADVDNTIWIEQLRDDYTGRYIKNGKLIARVVRDDGTVAWKQNMKFLRGSNGRYFATIPRGMISNERQSLRLEVSMRRPKIRYREMLDWVRPLQMASSN